jgi:hypothetical protein
VAASAVLAPIAQQARAYVFKNGVRAIEPESFRFLNFNDAKAAQTLDANQVPGNLGQPELLDW